MSSNYCGNENMPPTSSSLDKATFFYRAGFPVIPIRPNTKVTAVKWDRWLRDLSEEAIRKYWSRHPDHGVGFIVPENVVVLDADSPSAVSALYQIEESFDISPRFIVKTKRGEHHYFRLAPGTKVKTCSMDTAKVPHGIDIKAKRSMVVLP
jgi:hypothetical protein